MNQRIGGDTNSDSQMKAIIFYFSAPQTVQRYTPTFFRALNTLLPLPYFES